MKIQITSKLAPFSHKPGTEVLIPGGSIYATIYPTRLELCDACSRLALFEFDIENAYKDFTVIQDLERRKVIVFLKSSRGYLRYQLEHIGEEILFTVLKSESGLSFTLNEGDSKDLLVLKENETLSFPVAQEAVAISLLEKLSFGDHKKQDWQEIEKRDNPQEYLPFWYYLGQMVPNSNQSVEEGSVKYLSLIEKDISAKEKAKALERLKHVFKGGFKGLMVPLLHDEKHLGLFEKSCCSSSPKALPLLSLGYRYIREFFIQSAQDRLTVMPCLPKDFHAGRLINVSEKDLKIDIEWSKKLLKKLKITAEKTVTVKLCFQTALKSCRLKTSKLHLGKTFNNGDLIELVQGVTYLFDNFKK